MIITIFLLGLFAMVLLGVMVVFASEILFFLVGKLALAAFVIGMVFVSLSIMDGPNLFQQEPAPRHRAVATFPPHPQPPKPSNSGPGDNRKKPSRKPDQEPPQVVEESPPASDGPRLPGEPLKVFERVLHDPALFSGRVVKDVPPWVYSVPQDAHTELIVISSQRFATLPEAWSQLEKSLAAKLAETGWISMEGTLDVPLKIDDLRDTGALQKECQITWPLEVGGFTEEVQQVVVEVRLTTPLRQKIEQAARNRMGRQNLSHLAWGFGIVSVCLAGTSVAIRRKA